MKIPKPIKHCKLEQFLTFYSTYGNESNGLMWTALEATENEDEKNILIF